MKRRDIISSLFWMVLGIGICYGGYDLELGTLHDPGSGFIFFWVGIIMIGLSVGILIRAIRENRCSGRVKKVLWTEIRLVKIISVLAALFLYAYVFTPLGFILSTVLLLIFLFKAVEPQTLVEGHPGGRNQHLDRLWRIPALAGKSASQGFSGYRIKIWNF